MRRYRQNVRRNIEKAGVRQRGQDRKNKANGLRFSSLLRDAGSFANRQITRGKRTLLAVRPPASWRYSTQTVSREQAVGYRN
jgi:hypothetical protein